jgi:hypothetical protein
LPLLEPSEPSSWRINALSYFSASSSDTACMPTVEHTKNLMKQLFYNLNKEAHNVARPYYKSRAGNGKGYITNLLEVESILSKYQHHPIISERETELPEGQGRPAPERAGERDGLRAAVRSELGREGLRAAVSDGRSRQIRPQREKG